MIWKKGRKGNLTKWFSAHNNNRAIQHRIFYPLYLGFFLLETQRWPTDQSPMEPLCRSALQPECWSWYCSNKEYSWSPSQWTESNSSHCAEQEIHWSNFCIKERLNQCRLYLSSWIPSWKKYQWYLTLFDRWDWLNLLLIHTKNYKGEGRREDGIKRRRTALLIILSFINPFFHISIEGTCRAYLWSLPYHIPGDERRATQRTPPTWYSKREVSWEDECCDCSNNLQWHSGKPICRTNEIDWINNVWICYKIDEYRWYLFCFFWCLCTAEEVSILAKTQQVQRIHQERLFVISPRSFYPQRKAG